MVAVLALLTSVIRHPMWSDPTALPVYYSQPQPIPRQPHPPWQPELHGQQQYAQNPQYAQWPAATRQQLQANWTGPNPYATQNRREDHERAYA